jgi:ArsR family transcriptional regulator, arsenate/arsenite/antimonite-responsive transcriptional repressor
MNILTFFDPCDMFIARMEDHVATATLEKPITVVADSCSCPPASTSPSVTKVEAETYAEWFKALADPTRIRILNLLAQSDEPVCVCEIVDQFPLGQSAISHHLKILRDVRFVLAERRGTFMYYRVNAKCLAAFPDAARRILDQ